MHSLTAAAHDALFESLHADCSSRCRFFKALGTALVTPFLAVLAPVEALLYWLLLIIATPFYLLYRLCRLCCPPKNDLGATLNYVYLMPILSGLATWRSLQLFAQAFILFMTGFFCCSDLRTQEGRDTDAALAAVAALGDEQVAANSQLNEIWQAFP